MKDLIETIDNGETEVQVATIGKVIGTNPVDGSPVEQNLTEESLKNMAEMQKDAEILVDADHESEIGSKTEAKGWFSGMFVKPGVGLFGKIKWTDLGRKLIENRVFRWLSPSWVLDKDTKEPMYMTSIALTNKPSQLGEIKPIVNSTPIELSRQNTTEEIDMTKEEIEALVEDAVKKMMEKINTPETKEDKDKKEEIVEKVKDEIKEDALNACGDETKTTVNQTTDETKEEVKDEVKEDDKEVIKIEALNSAPNTNGIDAIKDTGAKWQNLSGKDFIDWVNKGCK